jgi:predicted amidohydrolase YtcJ
MLIWTGKVCATSFPHSDACVRSATYRIAELAHGKAPGEWIVTMPIGDPPYYFDVPDILAEKRWPTRQELDAAAPRNPVFIRLIWG